MRPDLIDPDSLALHAGNVLLYQALLAGTPPAEIIAQWQTPVQLFQQLRKPYLLYNSKH
jgi:hypothetical protein